MAIAVRNMSVINTLSTLSKKEELREFILKNLYELVEMDIIETEECFSCGCSETIFPNNGCNDSIRLCVEGWLNESDLSHTKIIKKGEIIIIKKYSDEWCYNCSRVMELGEEMRPDSLLQQAIYSHGLATGFSGTVSPQEIVERIISLRGDIEICASWKSQMIGGCGLFIKGDVLFASNADLWSTLNGSGCRIFETSGRRCQLFSKREELDLTQWDHTEFIIKHPQAVGFWMKDWFYNANSDHRKIFDAMKKLGLPGPVCIVKSRH